MEHILQIGINIDDESVKEAAINQCAKQIMNDIKDSVANDGYYSNNNRNYKSKLKEMVDEGINKFCEDNKEIIINGAIDKLAEKLSKTKLVKEKIKELGDGDI